MLATLQKRLAPAVLGTLLGLLSGCSESADPQKDLDLALARSFQPCSPPGTGDGGALPGGPRGPADTPGLAPNAATSGDDDLLACVPLSEPDARALLRAAELLERLPEDVRDPEVLREPFTSRLIARARTVAPQEADPKPETVLARVDVSKLSKEEARSLARLAEAQITEVAERLETAAMDQALFRFAAAAAELGEFLRDLNKAEAGGRGPAIKDPFTLVPRDRLSKAQDGLRGYLRRLAEKRSRLGITADKTEGESKTVESLIARIGANLKSPERAGYEKDPSKYWTKVPKERWDAMAADRPARVQAQLRRSREELASATGRPEYMFEPNPIRGPPHGNRPDGALEKLVLDVVSDFDIDVGAHTRKLASVLALSEEVRSFEEVPEPYRKSPEAELERVLCFVDRSALERVVRLVRRVAETSPASTEDFVLPDRVYRLKQIDQAVRNELQRRDGGGQAVEPPYGSDLAKVVATYTTGEALPTARARARFLGIVQSRFHDPSLVPEGLRDAFSAIVTAVAADYQSTLERLTTEYQTIADQFALSRDVVPEELLKRCEEARRALHDLYWEYERFRADAKARDVVVTEKKSSRSGYETKAAILVAAALFGGKGDGPFPPEPPAPGVTPRDRPPSGPRGPPDRIALEEADLQRLQFEADRLRVFHVKEPELERPIYYIEGFIANARDALAAIGPMAGNIETGAEDFAGQTGRFTVRDADIRTRGDGASVAWTDFKSNPDHFQPRETRLPGRLANWKGRLDEQGNPFDYKSVVKDPKSFRAVGGGIHFGETATPPAGVDLSKYAVIGAVVKKDGREVVRLVLRDGATGRELLVDESFPPIAMKSLYRFVSSGRNAAVSIGWAMERTAEERLNLEGAGPSQGSPVLLDPFLVDTPIGQDLVLADSIPWRLGEETLPNGTPIPFHAEFKAGLDAFVKDRLSVFTALVAKNPSFSDREPVAWADGLDSSRPSLLVKSLLLNDTIEKAKAWFLARSLAETLRRDGAEGVGETAGPPEVQAFILKKNNIDSMSDLTDEGQEKVREAARKIISAFNDNNSGIFNDKNLPSEPKRALSTVLHVLLAGLLAEPKQEVPRKLVELWVALQLEAASKLVGDSPDKADTARKLVAFTVRSLFSSTTLAMLYDDAVTFRLDGDSATIEARMRYRYATSAVRATDEVVGVGKPNDPSDEVQTIASLTDLASAKVDDLAAAYPPLARVVRAAKVAAFLRWAREARQRGEVAAIDLSVLGRYPGHDRNAFPTPDSLIR